MKVGITCPVYPRHAGGGVTHANEVIKRLVREFDITLFPSSDSLFFISNNDDKEKILKRLDDFSRIGIKVSDEFVDFLDRFKPMSTREKIYNVLTVNIVRELTKRYMNAHSHERFDFIYDPVFALPDVIMLSRLSNGKYGFTHQANLMSRYAIVRLWKYVKYSWPAISLYGLLIQVPPSVILIHIKRLMSIYGKPRFIALVSRGQAEILGIDQWNIPYYILNPANAIDPELLNHRDKKKDDYLVFYARLHPEKGVFELPKIIKIVKDEYDRDVRLKVMGLFPNDEIRQLFFKLVKKYGVSKNIEYLGFVNEENKHNIVARAKALIYPSHNDFFSLVILESLALGTPVIAYRIPGPYSVFAGLPGVEFVKEFDVKALARRLISVLKNYGSYLSDTMNSERLMSFIKLHTSWDLVAEQIIRLIKYHNHKINHIDSGTHYRKHFIASIDS